MHLSLQARFRTCILFYCNGFLFLHGGWCDAMFWIYNLKGADNTPVFLLLLSSVYTVSRPFLLLPPPQQRGGAQGAGRGHSWDTTADGRSPLPHGILLSKHCLGKGGGKGTFGVMAEALLSGKWPNICLPRKQRIN